VLQLRSAVIGWLLLLFSGNYLLAQYPVQERKIAWPADSVFSLDSLTPILPSIRNPEDPAMRFTLEIKTNRLRIIRYSRVSDSIRLQYAAFPFGAHRVIRRFPLTSYDSLLGFADYPVYSLPPAEKKEELFTLPGIQKSGVISRGISLSNGQNGFVNSAMNLQLEGMLSKEIRLTALISDQSMPFQPEGNTSQIRELDRIFIRLEHRKADLIAGDLVLKDAGNSDFFRLFRNIQGAELNLRPDSSGKARTRLAAGIAKGKFASIILQVKEGVHGPYRLRPPDNPDLLFVILAGSERIWLDGRLLKRGFNQDYVIDYNTGDLTINNNLLLTRFTRLRCDFEYAERNYSRTSFLAEHQQQLGRWKLRFGHYQEQDNPDRPLGFTLDSMNQKVLQNAGDKPGLALLSGIVAVSASSRISGNLYYEARDTLLNGDNVRFFRAASENTAVVYQLTFSETPAGQGDYILLANLGNGKRFVFAGPGLGNYRIGKPAVLPDRKAMSRAAIELELGKGHRLETEGAYSFQDANRLSSLDERDNAGDAQRMAWTWLKPTEKNTTHYQNAGVCFTRLSRQFKGLDRFRSIEFERNWNGRSGDTLQADDYLLESRYSTGKKDRWELSAESNWRKKGANVLGFQQSLRWNQQMGPFVLENNGYWMENQRQSEKASWRRASSLLMLNRYWIKPFWQFQLDENEIRNPENQVLATAMHFRSQSLGLRSADTATSGISAVYTYREDRSPVAGRMTTSLFSQNAEISTRIAASTNHQVELTGNYRLTNPAGTTKTDENLSARLDYRGSTDDGFLRQELVLTANTGQEARRSFQFIRINAIGEGSHHWIDYNGNGLQELDEFVEALRPEDRQYIKVFIPTQDFITAYTRSLNYRLQLGAPASWQNRKGWRNLLARFALLSSLAEDRRITSGTLTERYLPLHGRDGDQVLSAGQSFRNTLFYNRSRSDFGAELMLFNALNKTLLSNGFSRRNSREQRLLIRKNLGRQINLTLRLLQFDRVLESDALAGFNYQLRGWEAGPELAWQPGVSHRISGQITRSERMSISKEEKAENWVTQLEYRGGMAGTRSINAIIRYNEIRFRGNNRSAAAYELLEGLLPGENITWTLNVQQKLARGLQLLLTYEGRKSGNLPSIHLGKVQANLLF
jgi:hypothetical protein